MNQLAQIAIDAERRHPLTLPPRPRVRAVGEILGVAALFALMTAAMTWPLATRLDEAVIGWPGDNYLYIWMIGWFQKALFELHHSPLTVPILNYPEGFQLAYTDIPFSMVFLGLPASLAANPILGYNVALITSFVLSGLGMYWWVRRLTGSFGAGLVAGTIFAFAPYRMSHLFGHLNLMGTQWFPFYFLGLGDLLATERWSWKSIALTAGSLVLIGVTSQYYLYMTLLLSVIYVASYLALMGSTPARRRRRLSKFAVLMAVAAPFLLLAIVPYLQVTRNDNLAHTFEAVRTWSASPSDFLLPSPRHVIWGEWIAQHFDRSLWVENTVYVGMVTLVLAALAVVKVRRPPALAGWVKLWIFMALVTLVLALGVELRWLGQPVLVDVPAVFRSWYPAAQTSVPLPGLYLFKYLPFYSSMRVWMRYGIFVTLFLSALAGVGAGWALAKTRRPAALLLTAALCLLVLLDFATAVQPLTPVGIRSVDVWLAAEPDAGAVAQFPFADVKSPSIAFATLAHGHPFIGDPFGTFLTPQYRRIQPVLDAFPSPESVALLQELGIRWVVVDASHYEDFAAVDAATQALGLTPATVVDGQYVYRLEQAGIE